MSIEVIAIGSEIIQGSIVNTNASFISSTLFHEGYSVNRHTAIDDEPMVLKEGFKEALSRNRIVIATGGLGSTCDDHTRKAAAELFESPFHRDKEVYSDLEKRFGKEFPVLEDQSTIPVKAKPIFNRIGTAPGLIFSNPEHTLILMPGVPQEMRPMFLNDVLPYLKSHFPPEDKRFYDVLHFCHLSESLVDPHLRELHKLFSDLRIGIYPNYGTLSVRMAAKDQKHLQEAVERLKEKFKTHLFPSSSGKIEEAIHHEMIKRKKKLAFAESCTGGLMAAHVTALSGASDYFLGSLVVYCNELKKNLLGVSENTLSSYGAVSSQVVLEMLQGLFKVTSADCGIAISGIAGPNGGTPEKPVGTVWMAIGERGKEAEVGKFLARGSRETIILWSSNRALASLWRKMAYDVGFEG